MSEHGVDLTKKSHSFIFFNKDILKVKQITFELHVWSVKYEATKFDCVINQSQRYE